MAIRKEKSAPRKRSKESKSKLAGSVAAERAAADQPPSLEQSFPVVGVGASAGGLEAFKKLLQAMPPDAGIAFVFIPHELGSDVDLR